MSPFFDYVEAFVTGFLCCQYDNVGIFLTSDADAVEWQRRIKRAEKEFNVKWKEIYKLDENGVYDVRIEKDVYEKDEEGVDMTVRKTSLTFLGAELKIKTATEPFKWRHDEKKLKKWLVALSGAHVCTRHIAKIVGILIWDATISLEPLSAIAPEINVLRGVSKRRRIGTRSFRLAYSGMSTPC